MNDKAFQLRTRGLVIGGQSGVGANFVQHATTDPRFKDVDWYSPSQMTLDVRRKSDIDEYMRENGPFSYMVYTAGINKLSWVSDLEERDLLHAYEVNVLGFVKMCGSQSAIFPNFDTRVVAVVSDSSRTPMRGSVAYCSSKAALVSAIKCMARELAPYWSVNGVSPGIIEDTPMTSYIDSTVPDFRGWDPVRAKQYEQSMIPMGRRATKDEVSHLLLDTLTSPKYMSGNITELTGGK